MNSRYTTSEVNVLITTTYVCVQELSDNDDDGDAHLKVYVFANSKSTEAAEIL